MKTEKAIEFIKGEITYWGPTICKTMKNVPYKSELGNPLAVKLYKEIIILLQQGENDRIENKLLRVILHEITIKSGYFSKRDKEYIKEVKQKYFQKPSANFTEKVMEKTRSKERAIDNQGDIDDDFEERSEGIEKFGGKPMTE